MEIALAAASHGSTIYLIYLTSSKRGREPFDFTEVSIKSYQVFIGCPFLNAIRKNYDRLKSELEDETPLHIVLADTSAISSTDYLLEQITTLIREMATCVFDVTGGNPNV